MVLTTFLSGEGGLRTCMVTATRALTLYFTSFITAAEVDHFPVREEGEDARLSEAADQVYAPDLAALLEEAERLYGEGSFDLAHQQYLQVMGHDLPAELELETAFRLADTRWRSRGASRQADASSLEAARKTLENLLMRVNELETLCHRTWHPRSTNRWVTPGGFTNTSGIGGEHGNSILDRWTGGQVRRIWIGPGVAIWLLSGRLPSRPGTAPFTAMDFSGTTYLWRCWKMRCRSQWSLRTRHVPIS